MGKVWSAYASVIDNFLNKEFLLASLVLFVAEIIGFLAFVVLALLLALLALLGPVGIALAVLLGTLGFVALLTLFTGLGFHLALGQLERNKVEFQESFQRALANWFQGFKVMLAWFAAFFLFFGLLLVAIGFNFVASILPLIGNVASLTPESLVGALAGGFLALAIAFMVLVVLGLLLAPFTILLMAVPFAEGLGLRASVQRVIALGRAHYLDNLKFVALNILMATGAGLVFYVLLLPLLLLAAAVGGLAGLGFTFELYNSLASLLGGVVVMGLNLLYQARVYLYNARG